MRESRLQSKIISYLKANGIYYVNTYGSGMTAKRRSRSANMLKW